MCRYFCLLLVCPFLFIACTPTPSENSAVTIETMTAMEIADMTSTPETAAAANIITVHNRGPAFKNYWDKYKDSSDDEKLVALKEEYIPQFSEFYDEQLTGNDDYLLARLATVEQNEEVFFDRFDYVQVNIEEAMNMTLAYYDQSGWKIDVYIDPLISNGGQGVWDADHQGTMLLSIPVLSGLEQADAIFSEADKIFFNSLIAHEMSHIIHQNVLGYNLEEHLFSIEENVYVSNVTLFTEGLSTYASSVILGTSLEEAMIFYSEYLSGDTPPELKVMLDKFKTVTGLTIKDVLADEQKFMEYRAWFSPNADYADLMPFKGFRAIGYYLGANVLSDYAMTNNLKIMDLMALDLIHDIPEIVQSYIDVSP